MEYSTDLKVIIGKGEKAPAGYTKINQDLNEGACGSYLYLCYKKEEATAGIVQCYI